MNPPIAYFGHHKCASSWILTIVSQACKDMGLRHKHFSNAAHLESSPEKYIRTNKLDFVSYTNSDYNVVRDMRFRKAFHVIRDPRDLITSAYFSHKKSHTTKHWPDLIKHREHLNSLSKEQGLEAEIQFSRRFIEEIQNWNYLDENVTHVRMEDLIRNSYKTVLDIFSFLDLLIDRPIRPTTSFILNANHLKNRCLVKAGLYGLCSGKGKISPERLLGILHQHSYKFLAAGRSHGQEDTTSHYRKGISGDWANHFTKQHGDLFLKEYGDILIHLGYEKDDSWVDQLT